MPESMQHFFRRHQSVEFLQCQWVDLLGVLRSTIFTKRYVLNLVNKGVKELYTRPSALFEDYVPREHDTELKASACKIVPDLSSLRECCYNPRYATIMCRIWEEVENMQFKRDPRSRLQETQEKAKGEFGLDFLVGFDMQFVLMKPADNEVGWERVQSVAGWSSASGLRGEVMSLLGEIALQLQSSEIEVERFNTGNAQGIIEIGTGSKYPMMAAADALTYAVEAVKSICCKNGFKATFFPRHGDDHIGQVIYLWMEDALTKHSVEEIRFLAGLLRHIRAVCAFTMPNFDSFPQDVQEEDYRGTNFGWVSWGTETQDVPIRKIRPGHWELRFVDGTANIYLSLSAVILAGLLGIKQHLQLTICEAHQSLDEMTKKERRLLGIKKKFPIPLREAISALTVDEELHKDIGEDLYKKYKHHKFIEEERLILDTEDGRRIFGIQYW